MTGNSNRFGILAGVLTIMAGVYSLDFVRSRTHGLRLGLHSYAASRLNARGSAASRSSGLGLLDGKRRLPQGLKPAFLLSYGGTAESRALPEIIFEIFCSGFCLAPLGLDFFRCRTHGLRRGLHSFAAPRLKACGIVFARCP